jgi:cellulase
LRYPTVTPFNKTFFRKPFIAIMPMSKIIQTSALVAALISTVTGHTSVEKFEAGGKTYEGYRQASKQDPGNQSPAWWTNQGWGYQPIYGDKLNQ